MFFLISVFQCLPQKGAILLWISLLYALKNISITVSLGIVIDFFLILVIISNRKPLWDQVVTDKTQNGNCKITTFKISARKELQNLLPLRHRREKSVIWKDYENVNWTEVIWTRLNWSEMDWYWIISNAGMSVLQLIHVEVMANWQQFRLRDFRHPQQSKWDTSSSGMLRCVNW
jgi:hypothetical protein